MNPRTLYIRDYEGYGTGAGGAPQPATYSPAHDGDILDQPVVVDIDRARRDQLARALGIVAQGEPPPWDMIYTTIGILRIDCDTAYKRGWADAFVAAIEQLRRME